MDKVCKKERKERYLHTKYIYKVYQQNTVPQQNTVYQVYQQIYRFIYMLTNQQTTYQVRTISSHGVHKHAHPCPNTRPSRTCYCNVLVTIVKILQVS